MAPVDGVTSKLPSNAILIGNFRCRDCRLQRSALSLDTNPMLHLPQLSASLFRVHS